MVVEKEEKPELLTHFKKIIKRLSTHKEPSPNAFSKTDRAESINK